VRGLIEYIKIYSSYQEGTTEVDNTGLLENVTNFVSSTMLLYVECRSASQMDDLSITMREVTSHVANVNLKVDGPQPELTSSLFFLQDSLNKLNSLLQSKAADVFIKDQNAANEIITLSQSRIYIFAINQHTKK